MLMDYEQELSAAGGQLFNAADGSAEYGSKPYDLKAAGDAAIGEPLSAYYKVHDADSDVGTSLTIAVVADDDGAGTNEVVVATTTVLKANLTKAKGVQRIGIIPPGKITKRYLTAKVTTTGTAATAGKIKVWLQKATDAEPANGAFSI